MTSRACPIALVACIRIPEQSSPVVWEWIFSILHFVSPNVVQGDYDSKWRRWREDEFRSLRWQPRSGRCQRGRLIINRQRLAGCKDLDGPAIAAKVGGRL